MRALKAARKRIENDPTSPDSVFLAKLVLALESQTPLSLQSLYELDFGTFELALEILKEWRLDRHFSAKFRLMDASVVAQALKSA